MAKPAGWEIHYRFTENGKESKMFGSRYKTRAEIEQSARRLCEGTNGSLEIIKIVRTNGETE